MSFQIEIDKAIKEKKLYFVGDRLPVDWYEGFKLWMVLAETGDPKAQFNIGRCYSRGDGVDEDHTKAEYWYLEASKQNDPRALYNLYLQYKESPAATQKSLAEDYLSKAVDLGEPRALEEIKSRNVKRLHEERLLAEEQSKRLQKIEDEEKNKKWVTLLSEIQTKLNKKDLKSAIQIAKSGISLNINNELIQKLIAGLQLDFIINRIEKKEDYWSHNTGRMDNFDTILTKTYHYSQFVITINNQSEYNLSIELNIIEYRPDGQKKITLPLNNVITKKSNNEYQSGFSEYQQDIIGYSIILMGKSLDVYFKKHFSKSKPGGCFVLTACYGNENDPVVVNFRRFRDTFLAKHAIGKAFIRVYYEIGPLLADFIKNKNSVKKTLRHLFNFLNKVLPK